MISITALKLHADGIAAERDAAAACAARDSTALALAQAECAALSSSLDASHTDLVDTKRALIAAQAQLVEQRTRAHFAAAARGCAAAAQVC